VSARLVPRYKMPQSVPREFRQKSLEALRGKWRHQVMADRVLTGSTRTIGYWMADFMTMDKTRAEYEATGDIAIFPSQKELVRRTGFHIETVADGIAKLIKRGHLHKLRHGNQRTGSNRYLVIIKAPKPLMSI